MTKVINSMEKACLVLIIYTPPSQCDTSPYRWGVIVSVPTFGLYLFTDALRCVSTNFGRCTQRPYYVDVNRTHHGASLLVCQTIGIYLPYLPLTPLTPHVQGTPCPYFLHIALKSQYAHLSSTSVWVNGMSGWKISSSSSWSFSRNLPS